MGSCEICFGQKQDYHALNPLPLFYPNTLAETKVENSQGKNSAFDYSPSACYIMNAYWIYSISNDLANDSTRSINKFKGE
jgi:hypothetical protein